jgi:hypothetical protein
LREERRWKLEEFVANGLHENSFLEGSDKLRRKERTIALKSPFFEKQPRQAVRPIS